MEVLRSMKFFKTDRAFVNMVMTLWIFDSVKMLYWLMSCLDLKLRWTLPLGVN
jgi:hypothetical protein